MNMQKCPHCGVKLGNLMYADACPHCHKELVHNRKPTLSTSKADPLMFQNSDEVMLPLDSNS